ncbi:hypothetical protein GS506_16905 [Rhodococcus hoagii]|nr:hypothetical protein [Prescottella equi]
MVRKPFIGWDPTSGVPKNRIAGCRRSQKQLVVGTDYGVSHPMGARARGTARVNLRAHQVNQQTVRPMRLAAADAPDGPVDHHHVVPTDGR